MANAGQCWYGRAMATSNFPVALLALALAAACLFGAWQKLREGRVGWRWSTRISVRKGRNPHGFWLSVGANIAIAAALFVLAVYLLLSR